MSLVVGGDRRASGEASSGAKMKPTPTFAEDDTSHSTTGMARREPAGDGETKRRMVPSQRKDGRENGSHARAVVSHLHDIKIGAQKTCGEIMT